MNRSAPLARRTPLADGAPPTRTAGLRRAPIRRHPRSQPGKTPFPMTCPPGFHGEMMRRAGYACDRCGGKRGLTLSHRLDAGRGGPFTWWNIDVLCMGPAATSNPGGWSGGGCHDWRHANPEQARHTGWRVVGEIRRGVFYGADARFRELVDAAREAAA